MRQFHLLAGPNGSGKSTFTREVEGGTREVDYTIPRVINPDVIAQRLSPGNPDAAAAAAAREALTDRAQALARRESFSIETTLSGNAELRLIDQALEFGYTITMTYIALDSPDTNVDRVNLRADEERRTVPAADVRRRYERSLENLARVVRRIDTTYVYDNSGRALRDVMTLRRGRVVWVAETVPTWAERALAPQLRLARDRASVVREAIAQLSAPETTVVTSLMGEQPLPATGTIRGQLIVAGEDHIAVATSTSTFCIVERAIRDLDVALEQQVTVTIRQGYGTIEPIARSRKPGGRSR